MVENNQFQGVVPADILSRLIRFWWVVAAVIVLGGIVGSLFPMLRKPIYESTSVITTSIDFAYSGKLTDLEEDHMIVAIGNIIGSSEVMQKVRDQASSMGNPLNEKEMTDRFTLSRQGYQWELSTRFEDASIAQQLNRVWLTTAMSALDEVRLSSIGALKILDAGEAMEACFSQSVITEPAVTSCDPADLQILLSEISTTTSDQQEALTQFLLSRITTRVTSDPSMPEKPVLFNRNLTTLAGGLIGLILALAYFSLTNAKDPSH